MKNKIRKLIKELSEIYDENNKDNFISIYLNKKMDGKYLEKRVNACKPLLDNDERKNFIITIEEISRFLKKNITSNIAIFASHKHNLFKSIPLHIEVNNLLIVDSSPYIRPLVRILDEFRPFTLILINSNHAKIFSVYLGKIDDAKYLSSDIMSKHKKGGWSQARFQRIRKGAIHDFFLDVLEMMKKIPSNQIILAGPGPEKIQFRDMLPKNIQQRIIDVIDIDMDDEKNLLNKSIHLISKQEEGISHKAVEHLIEEILTDGLAVYGFDDTLKAVKNGQVELLIVEKDYKLKGCICEHCQIVKSGPVKDCPVCGEPVSEADVIEEIIEFAERTDAKIEFTDNEEISKLGHIGGILRYKS
jgi:peptide chain release factor subunit 1